MPANPGGIAVAALATVSALPAAASMLVNHGRGPTIVHDSAYSDSRTQVHSWTRDVQTQVRLMVTGLPANRTFGAHVHTAALRDRPAGVRRPLPALHGREPAAGRSRVVARPDDGRRGSRHDHDHRAVDLRSRNRRFRGHPRQPDQPHHRCRWRPADVHDRALRGRVITP